MRRCGTDTGAPRRPARRRFDSSNATQTGALLLSKPRLSKKALRDAGRALGRFDARPIAERCRAMMPVAVVVTERDRLIRPAHQLALARAWAATVIRLDADHDAPVAQPERFRAAIVAALAAVDGSTPRSRGNASKHFAHPRNAPT